MEYKNYKIERFDELNWTVERFDKRVAKNDIKSPSTGEVFTPKGGCYESVTRLGYFAGIDTALNAVIRDMAGRDCETVEDLAQQIAEIKDDLSKLLKLEAK